MNDRYRWPMCCHESGHAIATIVLGGDCIGIMSTVDGGLAFSSGLYSDRDAFMVACGPEAERLANEFDQPTCEPFSPDEVALNLPAECDQTFARWATVANVPGVNRTAESDSRKLALWAIQSHEDDPDSWKRRLEFANFIAAKIIETNKEAILRVARELYERGALAGDRIKQIYEGQNGK